MKFELLSLARNLRITPVSVNADGSVAAGAYGVTVAKGATGVYTVTLASACQQLLFPLATVQKAGAVRCIAQATKADITTKVVKVKTFSRADAAADAPFDLFLIGSDGTGSVYGNVPTKVRASLLNPRLLAGYYDGANDALALGKHEFSISKTGTGVYVVTFAKTFPLAPYVLAITNDKAKIVEYSDKSETGVTLNVSATATGNAADAEVFFVVLGSFAKTTYQRHLHPVLTNFPNFYLNPFEISAAGAMTRGAGYLSCTRVGAGDFDLTPKRQNQIKTFAMVMADGSANIAAVDEQATNKFSIKAEGDSVVFGAEFGLQRGYRYTV